MWRQLLYLTCVVMTLAGSVASHRFSGSRSSLAESGSSGRSWLSRFLGSESSRSDRLQGSGSSWSGGSWSAGSWSGRSSGSQTSQLSTSVANGSLLAVAQDLGDTTLVNALQDARLESALGGSEQKTLVPEQYTLFSPTNEAFESTREWRRLAWRRDSDRAADILKYHMLAQPLNSSQLVNDQLVDTLSGDKLRLNVYDDGKSKVVTACGCLVTLADQQATNGVLHEVDRVMIPPQRSLKDLLRSRRFSTLRELVKDAGLEGSLDGPPEAPYTMFAPTDDAFEALPKGAMDVLKKQPEILTEILAYHMVPTTQFSVGLTKGKRMKTVQGESISVRFAGGDVYVGGSQVTSKDRAATNGVLHAIDMVLLPPSFTSN